MSVEETGFTYSRAEDEDGSPEIVVGSSRQLDVEIKRIKRRPRSSSAKEFIKRKIVGGTSYRTDEIGEAYEPPARKPLFGQIGMARLSLVFSVISLIIGLILLFQFFIEGIAMSKNVVKLDKMVGDLQPVDCSTVTYRQATTWNDTGGVYVICPQAYTRGLEVYCDVATDGGRWLVFQRRMNGRLRFDRKWKPYVRGFGNAKEEFWLGLEAIHKLTQNGSFELRIDMMDWYGNRSYAHYRKFKLGDAKSNYKLYVRGFDSKGTAGDSLSWHHGAKFSTFDNDNDNSVQNCADRWDGGWWYENCFDVNLNGLWVKNGVSTANKGIIWKHFAGLEHSLKFTEMKFRKLPTNSP